MLLHPGVEFKPVEGDALGANGDFGDMGADFGVEAVAVHAQVARGVAEADQPGEEREPRGRRWLVPRRRAHRASRLHQSLRAVDGQRGIATRLAADHRVQIVDLDPNQPADAVSAQTLCGDRATQRTDGQSGDYARLGERHVVGTDG